MISYTGRVAHLTYMGIIDKIFYEKSEENKKFWIQVYINIVARRAVTTR
jgi:hypothetical protein